MSIIEFVEGPMWYFAATVFTIGAVWKVANLIAIGRKPDLSTPRASASGGFIKGNLRHFLPRLNFAERTWMHLIAGYAFHFGLFAVLFLAAPHVKFIEQRITGFGWPAMSRTWFIIMAEVAFAGLIVLWVRRIADPVMRQISDADDHIGSWLTFLVMLTGCFALGEASVALRALHMGLVNLWLIYFPFSRLMHAFTFSLARGYTGAIYGRRGITP